MNKPAAALRSGAVASDYRVCIVPVSTVIDAEGVPLDHAQVLEISFPGDTIGTPIGRSNIVVGAGVAKILVGDATIRSVPLC